MLPTYSPQIPTKKAPFGARLHRAGPSATNNFWTLGSTIMIHKKLMFSLLSLLFVFGTANASAPGGDDAHAAMAQQRWTYPLKECLVSGEKFTREAPAVSFVVDGTLLRTCCDDCAKLVKAEPAKHIARVHDAIKKHQRASYPFEKCFVSDEVLGSMGDPIELVYHGRLVRLCCKGCVKTFKKDPAKHLATINEAMIAKQRESYPFKNCIVSDEGLEAMGRPIDRLYGTTLVRMCCKGCIKGFEKNPEKFLAKIHEARAKHDKKRGEHGERKGHDKKRGEHEGRGEHGEG